jgi:hypothetical protein
VIFLRSLLQLLLHLILSSKTIPFDSQKVDSVFVFAIDLEQPRFDINPRFDLIFGPNMTPKFSRICPKPAHLPKINPKFGQKSALVGTAQDGRKRAQEGPRQPKTAQDGPKMAPRRPRLPKMALPGRQNSPKTAKNEPKTAPITLSGKIFRCGRPSRLCRLNKDLIRP